MRRPLAHSSALSVLLTLAPATAFAAEWLCHLSSDAVRLVCVAEPPGPEAGLPETPAVAGTPAAAATTGTGAASPPITAVVNGTRFPLDTARMWFVELWSPPNERADVERLARATICYRSPGCTVTVLPWGR